MVYFAKEMKNINHRRIFEEQRRLRILNTKVRQIGIDKEALDAQLHEKQLLREQNQKFENKYAIDTRNQDALALYLQEQERQLIKENNKEIDQFRLTAQKPENSRDFDLYNPNQMKTEKPPRMCDDDYCPVSGIQKLAGEDSKYAKRLQKQKNQVHDLLLQQIDEKRKQKQQLNKTDDDLKQAVQKKDRLAFKMACLDIEDRKNTCRIYNQSNKNMALQKEENNIHQKLKENIENQRDIEFNFHGDLLSENPSVARNTIYSNRVLPDRWKGMTPTQLDGYYRAQKEQIQENQKKRAKEKHQLGKWNEHVLRTQLTCRHLDTKEGYERLQFQKRLELENKQLALRQKEEKDYLYKVVYSNVPTEEFFGQFNTSSR